MTASEGSWASVDVEAYAGVGYPERPLRVGWRGEMRAVIEVERQWQEPDRRCFLVALEGDIRLLLCYDFRQDVWSAGPIGGT